MKLPFLIFFFKILTYVYMYLYRICDAISMSIMKKDRYYIALVETMKQMKGGPLNVR